MGKGGNQFLWGLAAFAGLLAIANKEKVVSAVQSLIYPIKGKITSAFGSRINPISKSQEFHNGVDLAGSIGDPIKAPAHGIVISKYYSELGGNQLIIKHLNGFKSGYAHLNKSFVNIGDPVKQGDLIAEVGKSGQATGPHLHFTLRNEKDELVNPEIYLT